MDLLQRFISELSVGVGFGHPLTLGILFLMGILSDIGFPLFFSIETFLFFTAYKTGPVSSQTLLVVLMLFLGREAGASILYAFARLLGEPLINWLGKRSRGLPRRIEKLKERIKRRPGVAVATVRLIPGLLQFPGLVAGVLRLRYNRFAIGVAASSMVYDFTIIGLGFSAHVLAPKLETSLETYLLVGFFGFIIAISLILYFTFRHSFGL